MSKEGDNIIESDGGADPLLGALADNGGATQTLLPQDTSPAIDAVTDCTDSSSAAVTEDQRGVTRPQGDSCDIGAVEVTQHQLTVAVTGSGTVTNGDSSVNCGSDCDEYYFDGNTDTLTATAGDGHAFDAWSGDCDATSGNTCDVTMDAAKSVSATFTDIDGVDDTTEDGVPTPGGGTGDGNGDGTPDSEQEDVASLTVHGDPTKYATLDATDGSGLNLANVATVNPGGTDAPADVLFPFGMFTFDIVGVAAGDTVTMKVFVERDESITGYLKKNNDTGEWDDIATDVDHTTYAGKTVITFPLTNGGPYDDDGDAANDTISDPGGPVNSNPVPTLGEWGVILLALLLAGMAIRRRGGPTAA